jgi:hypothetical protein
MADTLSATYQINNIDLTEIERHTRKGELQNTKKGVLQNTRKGELQNTRKHCSQQSVIYFSTWHFKAAMPGSRRCGLHGGDGATMTR